MMTLGYRMLKKEVLHCEAGITGIIDLLMKLKNTVVP